MLLRTVRGLSMACAVLLAGCSANGTGAEAGKPAQLRPERIVAAPSGVLSAAEPQPNGTVWVLAGGPASRGLFRFDLGTGRGLGSVSVSGDARAVTQSVTGVVGLALGTAHTGALQLLDNGTAAVTRTVALGGPARAVALGADGTTFFVLNGNGNGDGDRDRDGTASSASVTMVNSASGQVLGTIAVPPSTVSIAPVAQQSALYALQSDGRISEITTASGKVIDTFTVGDSGESLAISPDGSTMYALKDAVGGTAADGTNVAVVNLATGSIHRVLPAPAHCLQVLVSADGTQLYELAGTAAYGNIAIFAA